MSHKHTIYNHTSVGFMQCGLTFIISCFIFVTTTKSFYEQDHRPSTGILIAALPRRHQDPAAARRCLLDSASHAATKMSTRLIFFIACCITFISFGNAQLGEAKANNRPYEVLLRQNLGKNLMLTRMKLTIGLCHPVR